MGQRVQVGDTVTVVKDGTSQKGKIEQLFNNPSNAVVNITLDDGTLLTSIPHATKQQPNGWYAQKATEKAVLSPDGSAIEIS